MRLDLAQETRHYVPRLYAVTIIGRDPSRFGYPAPANVLPRFRPDFSGLSRLLVGDLSGAGCLGRGVRRRQPNTQ